MGEHLTKSGYVNKDMLSSIRINLVPVDSAQDMTIVLTENEIQHVQLRGAENSLGFGMDDEKRLMWSNGYVCDWSFGVKEAKMVCSELGYSRIEKFETNVELPTSNAWERPLIKMYDIECQEYAMTLEGGHCTYSTHPAGINWDQCTKNNGIVLECSDLVLEEDETDVEIFSSNSEGCHFNGDVVDMGLVNTDEYCIGGDDEQDSFGVVTEVDVHGQVCLNFIVNDEIQCVFSEGTHELEGCGSTVMTTDIDAMITTGWEISNGFTAISNDQCSSSTFNGQPSDANSDTISKTFSGSGYATITFGNCGNSGDVILSFNGNQIASAHAGSYAEIVTFAYSHGEELKLSVVPDAEGNTDAVIRVQKLELNYPCDSAESADPTDLDYSFVGAGFCRASGCDPIDSLECAINGFWKDEVTFGECLAVCEATVGCNGFGYGDETATSNHRCYVYGEQSVIVPSGWNEYSKPKYDVSEVKLATGWQCFSRATTNNGLVSVEDIVHPNCYTSYDPSAFPENVEIISDAFSAFSQEGDSTATVTSTEAFYTYTISGKLVEYIQLDGNAGILPEDFSIDIKVTINGILNTLEFNLDQSWESTEESNISGLRCATSFQVEVISDQSQVANVCETIGTRPIDMEGKGIISGKDVEIQIRCEQLPEGTQAPYWSPPVGCECVETERTDGFLWPSSCATLPGSNETPFCYVDSSSCSSAVPDDDSNEFSSVECEKFVYWMPPSESNYETIPVEEFIQSEFPQWVKSDVYDFSTVDLVIINMGVLMEEHNAFLGSVSWSLETFLADLEARNVAVAMAGLNWNWDELFGLRTVFVGGNSVKHFPYGGEPEPVVLKESIEFDGEDSILMSGFALGQSISMASPLPNYSEDSDLFYNPAYNEPTSDFVTVATTTAASGVTRPSLVHHQTRPIINLPWTKDPALHNFELTQDGRQLVRNCFSWLRMARSQSNMGRRMLAGEADLIPESIQSHVLAIAVLTIVMLVSVSLCASGFCKRKESVKELNDQSTEVVCTF